MAELLWKNTLLCAALEDQYVKSKVYKPYCKCLPVKYSKKKKNLCYVNEFGETNYHYLLLLTKKTTR